jgi:hypothetical protein
MKHIFSIVKKCWCILLLGPGYSIHTQAKIVTALCELHNFICVHDPNELHNFDSPVGALYDDQEGGRVEEWDENLVTGGPEISSAEKCHADHTHDAIADAMWTDYQEILARRHLHEGRRE